MESIEITISPQGEVSYTVKGVKGAGCKKLTQAIDALGHVTETKNTAEFCQVPDAGQRLKARG